MATILTPQEIARRASLRLQSTLNFGGLVYLDYSEDFQKVGDTVNVKVPATFTADEFSGTTSVQAITEGSVPIVMDVLADVSVNVTAKEMTLDIDDFETQVIDGAVLAIKELIDQKLAGLYVEIPSFTGVAGVTPSTLKTGFTNPRKVLNIAKVPMGDRAVVFDPEAEAELLNLDAIVNADKANSDMALREGFMGKIMGMDTFMNQNVQTHVAGGYTALADVTITTGAAGATSIILTSTAGAAVTKLLKGDIFTLDGVQYTVTADTAAAIAGVVTVGIYPALPVAFGAMTAVTVAFADVTSRAHVANLAFHKNAFALVSRPLETPMDGSVSSYTTAVGGVAVRVTTSYNSSTKTNSISFDALFGVKTIQPELATRILG